MNGMENIAAAFTNAHPRACLMPYFTLGYPNSSKSLDIIEAIAGAGADLIELGIPFSDPLADGPSIQYSTQVALDNQITVAECIRLGLELRSRGVSQPILFMGYMNPILAYGIERFVEEAKDAGVNGFIIPDLPAEEALEIESLAEKHSLAYIHMLAPTSTEARIKQAAERSKGFVYLVSLTGITGARDALPEDLEVFIQRVRQYTRKPLALGFGISTPEHARTVGRLADGVIVGSAIIDAAKDIDKAVESTANLVGSMRDALELA
jgi:tryptophan synthase alpha chain